MKKKVLLRGALFNALGALYTVGACSFILRMHNDGFFDRLKQVMEVFPECIVKAPLGSAMFFLSFIIPFAVLFLVLNMLMAAYLLLTRAIVVEGDKTEGSARYILTKKTVKRMETVMLCLMVAMFIPFVIKMIQMFVA